MTLTVQAVPVEFASVTWPHAAPFIEKAIPYSNGDFTIDQLKLLVLTGQKLMLVITDEDGAIQGAGTVVFVNNPNDRVAIVTTAGGRLITGDEEFSQMCFILRQRGATKIQSFVRPPMAKLLKKHGFNEVAALVEVKL